MAGSYSHVVKDDGSLASNKTVADMLENDGDVVEAVEEMYGMIWYLASKLYDCYPYNMIAGGVDGIVEQARQEYQEGLRMSPTKRFGRG